jgi:cellulose synthase/poly-beta-1,6-N-acetylglucosamine synthase-like glycosyltransferase
MFLEALTVGSALMVVYHHVGYPILLKRLTRKRRPVFTDIAARGHRSQPGDAQLPSFTIVIPAYNEADIIADKIRNLAALDYPEDRLNVIVACDGCSDQTAARARAAAAEPECAHLSVTVLEFAENRGKVAVLNLVIPLCESDLIALSDASALISMDALLIAADHFTDPKVGIVCGTYRLLQPGNSGEDTYWVYQLTIKEAEAALGAPLGAHGAFYLLRRSLFRPLAPDTINDDFILPMQIVAKGYQAVYDRRMLALELEQASIDLDLRRRRRIAAGNMQQAIRMRRLMLPTYGGIAFAFLSGKALRAVMPFLMLFCLLGSAMLTADSMLFAAALLAQIGVYGLALARHLIPHCRWPRPVDTIHYLVGGHVAGFIGASRYLLGLERGRWRRAMDLETR